ncbi:hypothetical protein FBY39_0375 [Microbacterium sp. SLBN-146]|nr:hypothetical protein FBY39_0375 [Microbacterium sp. SLBN-146]
MPSFGADAVVWAGLRRLGRIAASRGAHSAPRGDDLRPAGGDVRLGRTASLWGASLRLPSLGACCAIPGRAFRAPGWRSAPRWRGCAVGAHSVTLGRLFAYAVAWGVLRRLGAGIPRPGVTICAPLAGGVRLGRTASLWGASSRPPQSGARSVVRGAPPAPRCANARPGVQERAVTAWPWRWGAFLLAGAGDLRPVGTGCAPVRRNPPRNEPPACFRATCLGGQRGRVGARRSQSATGRG